MTSTHACASVVVAAVAAAAAHAAPCSDEAAALREAAAADQAMRSRWDFVPGAGAGAVPRIVQLTEVVDHRNTERLKAFVARCGWPTTSRDGAEAVGAAWLLAQHADHDPAFQRRVLVLLGQAVAAGQAPGDQLAYLSDRVALAAGRPQLYGTQLDVKGECGLEFRPMDDRARVEARRRAIGWPDLDTYRQLVRDNALPASCRAAAALPNGG